jgi:uncharacterized surface protein with fasciclin (FAS1) repeats
MSNITQVVNDDKNMTTLKKVVIASGLDKTLSGTGPYTVFAPTDLAFGKLDKKVLENFLNDPFFRYCNDEELVLKFLHNEPQAYACGFFIPSRLHDAPHQTLKQQKQNNNFQNFNFYAKA